MTGWRALTLRQPWAWAVCFAGKDVENRTWPVPSTTPLPLPVMIHAAQAIDRDFVRLIVDERFRVLPPGVLLLGASTHPDVQASIGMGRGAVMAVATITGSHEQYACEQSLDAGHPLCASPWAEYDENHERPVHHWTLADVTPLADPVPAKGRQGLWIPDDETIGKVETQL